MCRKTDRETIKKAEENCASSEMFLKTVTKQFRIQEMIVLAVIIPKVLNKLDEEMKPTDCENEGHLAILSHIKIFTFISYCY